ncbi:hypothetical protein AAFF_G00207280 [Aldrovandia affinis]|uniref:Uncharacterized protein n=1 Tax=Aldrovandia affinis TaxID=143900 RepID=A0AAD7W5A0_9TELE|nr:hypothetical protein AAFF_G00207280 [Aldrovandia affinis]
MVGPAGLKDLLSSSNTSERLYPHWSAVCKSSSSTSSLTIIPPCQPSGLEDTRDKATDSRQWSTGCAWIW